MTLILWLGLAVHTTWRLKEDIGKLWESYISGNLSIIPHVNTHVWQEQQTGCFGRFRWLVRQRLSAHRSYAAVTIDSRFFLPGQQWSSYFRSIEQWNKSSSWVACPKHARCSRNGIFEFSLFCSTWVQCHEYIRSAAKVTKFPALTAFHT